MHKSINSLNYNLSIWVSVDKNIIQFLVLVFFYYAVF